MALLSAVGDYFGGFVHPRIARDELVSARHKTFILFHLCGGIAAFATLPLVLLARGGTPSPVEIAVLAWCVVPVLAALDLSRGGNLERACFTVSASLSALVFLIAVISGGIGSFALIWLPIAVFAAAFSGSRRVTVAAFGAAALAVVLLLGLEAVHLREASPQGGTLAEVSALLAVLYAAGLAYGWDGIQKTASASRHKHDTHYRLMAEHANDLVTRHSASGAVVFASPAAERLFGVCASELHGRGLFERVHIGDRPAFLTALDDARQGISGTVRLRLRGLSSAQVNNAPGFGWVEMRCQPAGDDQAMVVAVIREIAAREDAVTIDTDKVPDRATEAKGRFLANMSHELRTPLNAIIGFSEILANDDMRMDAARRREYADLIRESGLHLLSVVNGMLDMSRIDSGKFAILAEPFEMPPVVESCVQMFGLKAEKSAIRLSSDVSADLPELLADKRACKQILINLISNAIKFTPEGGDVRVQVRAERDDILIEVTDTGVGISSEDLPFVGTSFFQARSGYDRTYDGTGLGLSVVKGLIGLHGGTLEIDSELGKGTRVIVRLPRDPGEAVAVKTSTQSYPAHQEKRVAIG